MIARPAPQADATAVSVLESLPVHPAPAVNVEEYRLIVDGMVEQPLSLSLGDLRSLASAAVTEDFECLEGWKVAGQRWYGVPLARLLDRARPLANAAWIQASQGGFSLPLPLERAAAVLVALDLNDAPLAPEHGAPARLLLSGGECFTSIKWIEHIELLGEPSRNTAEEVARARLAARPDGV